MLPPFVVWQHRSRFVAGSPVLILLAVGCAASAIGSSEGGRGGAAAAAGGAGNVAGSSDRAGTAASAAGGSPAAGGAPIAGSAPIAGGSPTAGSAPAAVGGGSAGTAGAPHGSAGGGKCNSAGPNGEAFLDTFEDGELTTCPEWLDADPSAGAKWSVKSDGASQVLEQGAASSDWLLVASGDYRVTDQTVQAKVKFTSSPGIIGIFARVQDARNYYSLYLDGSNVVLRGRVDNSQLTAVKAKVATVEGTWYTLKLSVVGTTLTGYLDGRMLVTTTNAGVKAGGVGVGTSDSATGEFDEITVTVP
jgi:hypothetical protein